MYTFTLSGSVPSKKNKWKKGEHGMYLPADVKAWLEAAQWELQSQKNKIPGFKTIEGPVMVQADFFVLQHPEPDLDNIYTAVQDLLQAAGIIKNDKNVHAFRAIKVFVPSSPTVDIRVGAMTESTGEIERTIL